MALVLKDRISETTLTQGTGSIALTGATQGFQAFSSIGDGNTTYYCITDGSSWEVGLGTYASSGNTLARTTVFATSSGTTSPITLGVGTKNIFAVYPADRAVVVSGTTIQIPNSATLPITAGGTGSATATFSGANITSINANNVSTGILAVAQGGTGSSTATFSGENITSLNASNISSGTLANARTTASSSNGASTIVSRGASGEFSAGTITATFSGDGSAVTSINGSNISSGTVANARTTASASNGANTIVLRDASGDFAADIITANDFIGGGSSLTSLNASSISSGTIANARTTATHVNGASTIVARDASGNFAGATITGTSFSGSGASVTSINASNISSGTLGAARLGTAEAPQFGSLGVGTAASGTTGEIRATNNITAYYSDDRLKTKLGNIEKALEKVCSLSGFFYEANETAQALGYDPIREVGLSAQQVQQVLPEVVVPAPIDAKYLTLRYEKVVPLLVEAIKELKAEIDELKRSK